MVLVILIDTLMKVAFLRVISCVCACEWIMNETREKGEMMLTLLRAHTRACAQEKRVSH